MKKVSAVIAVSCALMLAACDVSTPSDVGVGRIRLDETVRTEVLDAAAVDPARVNIIADDFQRNGQGLLRAVISYDAASPLNAISAEKQGKMMKKSFAHRGVSDLDISYVAVTDNADAGKAVLSYSVVTALPPGECTVPMPGSAGTEKLENALDYKIGCETKVAISKMIAEPRDLEGRTGTPDGDSRRQGAVSEKYRSGKPNEPIKGLSSSEVSKKASGG